MNGLRVELLRRSLRAHTCAWIGMIPVLGLPFAMTAAINAFLCIRIQRQVINPARRLVYVAVVLGMSGMAISLLIAIAFVLKLIDSQN